MILIVRPYLCLIHIDEKESTWKRFNFAKSQTGRVEIGRGSAAEDIWRRAGDDGCVNLKRKQGLQRVGRHLAIEFKEDLSILVISILWGDLMDAQERERDREMRDWTGREAGRQGGREGGRGQEGRGRAGKDEGVQVAKLLMHNWMRQQKKEEEMSLQENSKGHGVLDE